MKRRTSSRINRRRFWTAVGWRIALIRSTKRRSQTQLANAVGISRTSITNIEAGKQRVPLEDLYIIAQFLGVGVTRLLPSQQEISDAR